MGMSADVHVTDVIKQGLKQTGISKSPHKLFALSLAEPLFCHIFLSLLPHLPNHKELDEALLKSINAAPDAEGLLLSNVGPCFLSLSYLQLNSHDKTLLCSACCKLLATQRAIQHTVLMYVPRRRSGSGCGTDVLSSTIMIFAKVTDEPAVLIRMYWPLSDVDTEKFWAALK